jgi:hypothetical protein
MDARLSIARYLYWNFWSIKPTLISKCLLGIDTRKVKGVWGEYRNDKYICDRCNNQLIFTSRYGLTTHILIIKKGRPSYFEGYYDLCPTCRNEVIGARKYDDDMWGSNIPNRTEEISLLKKLSYKDYLQTEWWKSVRQKALKRSLFRCQLCNNPEKLNVHHRSYENIGNEKDCDLITLCQWCHAKFHDKEMYQ